MAKYILINIDYDKYIRVPIEHAHIIECFAQTFKEEGDAYVPREGDNRLRMCVVDEEVFSKEAVEASHKKDSERYKSWWLEEQEEKTKLKKELDDLKEKYGEDDERIEQ